MAKKVLDALNKKFGDALTTSTEGRDDVAIVPRDKLLQVATFLKEDAAMAFDMPILCTAVDWLGQGREPRYDVVYGLRSTEHRHRVILKVEVDDEDLKVPSLKPLWRGFDWPEREVFDMYGIEFQNHGDMRRILMYDEFIGHPLRKDYPKEKRQPLIRRDWSAE